MIQDNVFYHQNSCHGNHNYTSNAVFFLCVLVKVPDLNCCYLFCSTLCNTPQDHKNHADKTETFVGIWYLPDTWILRAFVLLPPHLFGADLARQRLHAVLPTTTSIPRRPQALTCSCWAWHLQDTVTLAWKSCYGMPWYGMVWYSSIRCILVGGSTVYLSGRLCEVGM